MVDRAKYQEAKVLLMKTNEALKRSDLSPDEQQRLQLSAASLAGYLASPWLPVSWPRRLIMLGIVLLGLQQSVWYNNYQPFLYWLFLPFFSPRFVGEAAGLLGSITGFMDRSRAKRD
jgi:hypothetical protein